MWVSLKQNTSVDQLTGIVVSSHSVFVVVVVCFCVHFVFFIFVVRQIFVRPFQFLKFDRPDAACRDRAQCLKKVQFLKMGSAPARQYRSLLLTKVNQKVNRSSFCFWKLQPEAAPPPHTRLLSLKANINL